VQVDADIKVMSEFLVHLQGDSIRNMSSLSSLAPHQSASKTSREHSERFFPSH
jgi:phosphatidylinositol 4-kinase